MTIAVPASDASNVNGWGVQLMTPSKSKVSMRSKDIFLFIAFPF